MLSTSSFFTFLPAGLRGSAGSLLALADGSGFGVAGAACGFDAGGGGRGFELAGGGGGKRGVARVLSAGTEALTWFGLEKAGHWLALVLAPVVFSRGPLA